jgi:ParB family chromosome partitioning protein
MEKNEKENDLSTSNSVNINNDTAPTTGKTEFLAENVALLPVSSLFLHSNIREVIDHDSIIDLADSIKEFGLLHPIRVFQDEVKYHVILGQRRYLACKLCGLEKIPCFIVDKPDDLSLIYMQAVENEQTATLTPEEQRNYIRKLNKKFGQSFSEIAKRMGKGRTWVASKIHFSDFTDKYGHLFEEADIILTERDAAKLANADESIIKTVINYIKKNPNHKNTIIETAQKQASKNKGTSKSSSKEKPTLDLTFDEMESFLSSDSKKYKGLSTLPSENSTSQKDKIFEMVFNIYDNKNKKICNFHPEFTGDYFDLKLINLLQEKVRSFYIEQDYSFKIL